MKDGATDDLSPFIETVNRITSSVLECLQQGGPLEQAIEEETTPIYVKSSDSTMLYSNAAYRKVFSPDQLPIGRNAEAYLQETVIPISKTSDSLILSGCSSAIFDHFGHDSLGNAVLFRTAKRSLISIGHPPLAILGITHIERVFDGDSNQLARAALLTDKWNRFRRLDPDDREIAVMLAKGLSPGDIAKQKAVTKRTIENHRKMILESMAVRTTLDLVKLLVRLQEKGFGDFGV